MYKNLNEEGWPDMTVFKRQNILKQRSLILRVSFRMDDVVMETGLPVESYENKDNQQAY